MGQILLSIVIGTYNRLDVLKQCLASLISKINVSNEVIVVDAGSSDGTREYLQTLAAIKLICDEGLLGQAKSLNRVFRTLESKYVCWLSDDNIIQSGMLDQAVSILEQDPTIGMVSLKVRDISGPFANEDYVGGIWPSGVLNCNQGTLPVTLLNRIGGFDERFRDYGVDSDLTTRVLLQGYKVVYTKGVAIHHLRDHNAISWVDSDGRTKRMEYARELYAKKFHTLETFPLGEPYNKEQREDSLLLRWILLLYARARKLGISIQDMTGLTERDWRNLFAARFISKVDFLINSRKPYYLVQQIPSRLLQEYANRSQFVHRKERYDGK